MVLTAIEIDQWSGELDRLHARFADRFTRSEPRRRARQYLSGLVAGLVGVVDRGQVRLSARFSTVTIMPKAAPASTTVIASTMTSPSACRRSSAVAALLPADGVLTGGLREFVGHVAVIYGAHVAAVTAMIDDVVLTSTARGVTDQFATPAAAGVASAPYATVILHDAPMLITDTRATTDNSECYWCYIPLP